MEMPALERLAALICNRARWSVAGKHATWLRQALYADLEAAREAGARGDRAAHDRERQAWVACAILLVLRAGGHVTFPVDFLVEHDPHGYELMVSDDAFTDTRTFRVRKRARGVPPEGAGG